MKRAGGKRRHAGGDRRTMVDEGVKPFAGLRAAPTACVAGYSASEPTDVKRAGGKRRHAGGSRRTIVDEGVKPFVGLHAAPTAFVAG